MSVPSDMGEGSKGVLPKESKSEEPVLGSKGGSQSRGGAQSRESSAGASKREPAAELSKQEKGDLRSKSRLSEKVAKGEKPAPVETREVVYRANMTAEEYRLARQEEAVRLYVASLIGTEHGIEDLRELGAFAMALNSNFSRGELESLAGSRVESGEMTQIRAAEYKDESGDQRAVIRVDAVVSAAADVRSSDLKSKEGRKLVAEEIEKRFKASFAACSKKLTGAMNELVSGGVMLLQNRRLGATGEQQQALAQELTAAGKQDALVPLPASSEDDREVLADERETNDEFAKEANSDSWRRVRYQEKEAEEPGCCHGWQHQCWRLSSG